MSSKKVSPTLEVDVSFNDCKAALNLVSSILPATPLVKNQWLSKKYNANVYLKLENMQPVGSFKVRGAINKICGLSEEEKAKGIIAASAGNHAQGVAWAAQRFNVKASIVMPQGSPMIKILNTEALGAQVLLEGENVDESFAFVKEYLKEHDRVFVHPFHDPKIIAGQSTLGFELQAQLENIDYVFGGIGGGGMLAGVCCALGELSPHTQIIGAQARGASSMVDSIRSGHIVKSKKVQTFADGIKVRDANPDMFALLSASLSGVVSVDDDDISLALLDLMEQARIIAEGAGAISLAAFDQLFQTAPDKFRGKNIVLIISGGNIDINLVDRIIDKGLLRSRRRIKIELLLNDTPGALYQMTKILKNAGANVLHVNHNRTAPFLNLRQSLVEVTLETKGDQHSKEILEALSKKFEICQRD